MNFKPMGKRILLELEKETLSGSIIIPEEVESLSQRYGTVVALPGDEEITSKLKVGDKVMFEHVGVEMVLEGKDYKLIHIEYIQGLLS